MARSLSSAIASATMPPVIDAVRVPPSASSTSQSTVIIRSPSLSKSSEARSARPIKRWISELRPSMRPFCRSRRLRSGFARGCMEYSAVSQPRPVSRIQSGTPSDTEAAISTVVPPQR